MAVDRTWTDPATIDLTAGKKLTQVKAEQILSNLNHRGGASGTIGVHAYRDAAQSIATATETALAFNSERFDTDGIHDTAVNNSRLTCVTPGKYLVIGKAAFAAHATGYRLLRVRLGGATFVAAASSVGDAAVIRYLDVSTVYEFAAGNYIELMATHTSGAPLNIELAEFMMAKV